MEFKYSLNAISTKCGVSVQSLYKLINKNKPFFTANSTRRKRTVYYNQKVMDFFVSYYLPETSVESPINTKNTEDTEVQAEIHPSAEEPHKPQADALEAEINALKAEISALKAQLDAKEAERAELLRQNGALILTISQLQQEKMLLLPAPKKSFSDKVKSIFKGKPQEK